MTPPRGGKREGAGRPAKRGERGTGVEVWLPPSLATWALDYARTRGQSRSDLVAEALEAMRSGTAREASESAPTARPPAGPSPAADAEAYRALLAALAAAEPPAGGRIGQYSLPQDLELDVIKAMAAAPGEVPDAMALLVARGLVATRHLAEHSPG